MVRLTRALVVTLLLVVGVGVVLLATGKLRFQWSAKPAETGTSEVHETGHGALGKIVLDDESLRASGLRTEAAALGSVAVSLRVTGEVKLAEDRLAHVTPRIPGAIREVMKTLGDEVEVGTPLCTIESVELGEARAAHVSAHSERTLAERNHTRWQELFQKGLRSQNELWAAENEFTRSNIRHEAATGKLKALGIDDDEIAALDSRTLSNRYSVKSPVAGTVLERHATLGENVEAKDVILLVADLSEVWVQAAVYEKDLFATRKGMAGAVHTQAFPTTAFPGRVTYVGQKVDEKNRTVPLRLAVKNGPVAGSDEHFALRPGMFATVDLETSRKERVVVVPISAVQTVGDDTVVFVRQTATGPAGDVHTATFERRVVVAGERDSSVVEIVKGLAEGEQVVVENAYLLKSELEKSRIGEGE